MPTSANGRSELPPLPTIKSRRILQRIFTHRSLSKRPSEHLKIHRMTQVPIMNSKLVNLGDQVFGLIVTDLIRALFPNLCVGPSSVILYGLPQRLLVQTSQIDEVRRSPHAQGAYVGGLYKEQGMEIVNSWLFSLFKLFIHQEYDHIRSEHLIPT
ncbi:hypothetical protein BGW80DRAFT_1362718 [Lactifluus volemus]|nr:hypothetical protein BGW80DRAFT_1362718 [Lactifluus volemus]